MQKTFQSLLASRLLIDAWKTRVVVFTKERQANTHIRTKNQNFTR
jgi:hypothetical protein